jgi:hypothetical protein
VSWRSRSRRRRIRSRRSHGETKRRFREGASLDDFLPRLGGAQHGKLDRLLRDAPEAALNQHESPRAVKAFPIADRFWAKVDKSGSCWLWLATKTRGGYGRIRVDGKLRMATHVALELSQGIAVSSLVLHKCDTPSCVRPSHLFVGDQRVNMQDCAKKGRRPVQFGELNPNAKLNTEKVRRIRELAALGVPQKKIIQKFGTTQSTISKIVVGATWKNV